MELSSAVLQACRTIPVAQRVPSTDFAPTFNLPIRKSASFHSSFYRNVEMCKKQVKSVKRLKSRVSAAVVPDRTTRIGDASEEGPSLRDSSNAGANHQYDEQPEVGERMNGIEGDPSFNASRMSKICDKLIDVFMVDMPNPSDWRRCLTFSKEWGNIRPHFFRHCQEKAVSENDPGNKQRLLRLGRKIKEIDDDIQRHNKLLEVVRASPSEITEIVSSCRKDFTKEFFEHLQTVAASYYDSPTEHDAIVELGNACLGAVQGYDAATQTKEAFDSAGLKLEDIISSSDAAFRKIDNLAVKNQLDSVLAMNNIKAWAAGKDSNMTKEEVNDIMFDMYLDAVANYQVPMPKELRILKYIVEFEDPMQQLSLLRDAFTPGEEVEGDIIDVIYTTPKKLLSLIVSVIAYQLGTERKLHREAKVLATPEMVQRLEKLKNLIERHFM